MKSFSELRGKELGKKRPDNKENQQNEGSGL